MSLFVVLMVLAVASASDPEFSAYSMISVQSSKVQPYVYSVAGLYPPSLPPPPSPQPNTPVCEPCFCGKTPSLFKPM